MRGKIAIFIDGNNLFHAARSVGVEIDYAKFLNFLRGDSPLLRAFFYTGVDERPSGSRVSCCGCGGTDTG